MSFERRIAAAGFVATGVAYGPGWVGYGLFLPEFRPVFDLASGTAGLIASGAFAGFVVTLLLGGVLTRRTGPRPPVILGGLVAALGLGLVAMAEGTIQLALGVALAGASAGLSWVPFNNAATRALAPRKRPKVLSVVSTGTTVGIALAGGVALAVALVGLEWRLAWAAFAAAGVTSAAVAFFALRGLSGTDESPDAHASPWALRAPGIGGLCAVALSFGLTNATYLSFAADWIVRADGSGLGARTAAPLLFLAYGLCGLVGLFTGKIESKVGLLAVLRAIFLASAASHALIALLPASAVGALASAGLQGMCIMTISAVFSFWSARLFPGLPTTAFTATLLAFAIGAIAGPTAAGAVMDSAGAPAVFLAAAGLSMATALAVWPRTVVQGCDDEAAAAA